MNTVFISIPKTGLSIFVNVMNTKTDGFFSAQILLLKQDIF